jgi:hypothetical protein
MSGVLEQGIGEAYMARAAVTFAAADSPGGPPASAIRSSAKLTTQAEIINPDLLDFIKA